MSVMLALLFSVSVVMNALCVKLANRYSIGVKLSYKRSLLLVCIRAVVALSAGLAVGVAASGMVKAETIQIGTLELLVVCGAALMSFWAYKNLLAYFTGEVVRGVDVVKSVVAETAIFLGISIIAGVSLGIVVWLLGQLMPL